MEKIQQNHLWLWCDAPAHPLFLKLKVERSSDAPNLRPAVLDIWRGSWVDGIKLSISIRTQTWKSGLTRQGRWRVPHVACGSLNDRVWIRDYFLLSTTHVGLTPNEQVHLPGTFMGRSNKRLQTGQKIFMMQTHGDFGTWWDKLRLPAPSLSTDECKTGSSVFEHMKYVV